MSTPRAGRPAKADAGRAQQALLDAAFALFVQHGYAGTSLAAVAARAHVATRTIYVKFGGKRGLLQALIEAERIRHTSELAQLQLAQVAHSERLALLARHLRRRAASVPLMQLQVLVASERDL